MAIADLFGGPARLLSRPSAHGLDLLVLDAPHLFDRPGNPYLGPDGQDWPDNCLPLRRARLRRRARSAAARSPASMPDSCTRMTGRRGSPPPICATRRRGRATVV